MPIQLTRMSWDCGRKPEYTERTRAGTRRTPHRKTCDVIKLRTYLLRGDSASHYTTGPPFLFNYSSFSLFTMTAILFWDLVAGPITNCNTVKISYSGS